MPGVLIIEALAQVGAVAILSLTRIREKLHFRRHQQVRFKGKSGNRETSFVWRRKLSATKGPMGVGEAVASVDAKVVAQAELTFMVGAAQ